MRSLLVLGIDPGLSKLGFALVRLGMNGVASDEIVRIGVVETTKSDKKKGVRATSDYVRRTKEQARFLWDLLSEYTDLYAVCVEGMSFPRNAASSAMLGMSCGVVATLAQVLNVPVLEATPQEIKKRLCGNRGASKDEVKNAVQKMFYREFDEEMEAAGIAKSKQDHAFDAVGAVVACRESEVIIGALRQLELSGAAE